MDRYKRDYPDWFIQWQSKFYRSKQWIAMRNQVRSDNHMRCEQCGKLIRGKSIVDHITEITPDNHEDADITLGRDNLQLLCLDCHNTKTFGWQPDYDMRKRKNVNLF